MTKHEFLTSIKQSARISERVEIVWNAAVSTSDNDPKWDRVENHPDQSIRIQNFGEVFGVEIPVAVKKARPSYAEVLKKQIAKAKENHEFITNPEWKEQSAKDIAALEARLAAEIA